MALVWVQALVDPAEGEGNRGTMGVLEGVIALGITCIGYRAVSWRQRVRAKLEEIDAVTAAGRASGRAGGNGGVIASRGELHQVPWFAPILDASWMGAFEWAQLQAIDPRVVQAADFWLREDLSDLGSFREVVAEASEGANYASWFHALKGYVGEQVAADVLERSGIQVELASSPHQPGWDLLVDGKPYNVKVGHDPDLIREHFERYPEIDVITGPDLADQVPEYADRLLVLPELSSTAVEQMTESTITEALNLGWDVQLPVITALISSLREARLWFHGDSDPMTGLKHVALDVAGTGGGIALGGKLGAAIGSAILPGIGTVVGGFAGAVAGGILGRYAANQVKQQAFREAVERFQRAREETRQEWKHRQAELRQRVLDQIDRTERELREQLAEIERQHRAIVLEGKKAYQAQLRVFVEAIPQRLRQVEEHLVRREAEVLAAMPRSPWIVRLLRPAEQDVQWRAAQVWFQRQRRLVRWALDRAVDVAGDPSLPVEEAFERVRRLLVNLPLGHPELVATLEVLSAQHRRILELMALEQRLAAREARSAVVAKARELEAFLAQELEGLARWARERQRHLEELLDNVRREARKLGLDVAGIGER